MKRIMKTIAVLLAVCLLLPLMTVPAFAYMSFDDVTGADWYYDAVSYVYEKNLMNGLDYHHFDPNGSLTRGMFVTILGRMEGVYVDAYFDSPFADVQQGQWYSPYVQWAAEEEIVEGYGNGLFGTNDLVTREQMATMMARYLDFKGITLMDSPDPVAGFADAGTVSSWARDGLELMRRTGLINGSNGNFRPADPASRAEAATIFMRLHKSLQSTTISPAFTGKWVIDEWMTQLCNENKTMEQLLGSSYASLGSSMTIAHNGDFAYRAGVSLGGSGMISMVNGYTLRYQITTDAGQAAQTGMLSAGGENNEVLLIMALGDTALYWEPVGGEDDWKRAYYNYIVRETASVGGYDEYDTFQLLYLDDDDIPELYIDYETTADSNRLCTFKNGVLHENYVGPYSTLYYQEGSNLYLDAGGRMGYYYDDIRCLKDGEVVTIVSAHYEERYEGSHRVTDASGEPVYDYYFEEQLVTRQAYYDLLRDEISFDKIRSTGDAQSVLYDYYEILAQLNN